MSKNVPFGKEVICDPAARGRRRRFGWAIRSPDARAMKYPSLARRANTIRVVCQSGSRVAPRRALRSNATTSTLARPAVPDVAKCREMSRLERSYSRSRFTAAGARWITNWHEMARNGTVEKKLSAIRRPLTANRGGSVGRHDSLSPTRSEASSLRPALGLYRGALQSK